MHQTTQPSAPLTRVEQQPIKLDDFLEWQVKLWNTFTPPRAPNAFEVATARALWRAMEQATSGAVTGKFISLSAATGSGKTFSAVALLAYLHSRGRRATMLLAQIHQIVEVYRSLIKIAPEGAVAIWSSVHRQDAKDADRREYLESAPDEVLREHYVDPPRFFESECRKAPLLLTTHASWTSELEGARSLGIADRGLIIADEEPKQEVIYTFTSNAIDKLRRIWALEGAAPRYGFDNPIAECLARIRDEAATVEKDEVPTGRLRKVELVTQGDLALLADLNRSDLTPKMISAKLQLVEYDRLWDVVVGLKAAGQGRVFYSALTKQFFAYATALPPVPGLVVLDATADLSASAMSDTIHMVEDVPAPSYPNLEITMVHPPELVGQLKPSGLYKNRSGVEKVYDYVLQFILRNTHEDAKVLVYAKKDFLDKLSDVERSPTLGHRTIQFAHFGSGRGFNTWKDCDVYIRLSDAWPNKESMVAKLGSLQNRVFTEVDFARFSAPKVSHPALKRLCDLTILAHARQDLARTRVRQLDDQGRPRQPVKAFLIDPAEVVEQNLQLLWPGSPKPQLIGSPKTRKKALSGRSILLLAVLRNPEKHPELTPKLIHQLTGLRTGDLAQTLELPPIRIALKGWRKVFLEGSRGRRPWKLVHFAEDLVEQ